MSDIERLSQRPFGSTSLMVDPLCVGTSALSSIPTTYGFSTTEEQALATLRAVFDGPIRFIDTSNNYGEGRAERYIGVVLRERGGLPPDFVLSTKVDRDMQTGDFSGDRVRRSIEESQERLGMERFQIMYLHDPENARFEDITAPGGALDVLVKGKQDGLFECIGVAGGPIDLMMRYLETGAFDAVLTHNRYNLLSREAEPLLDMAAERGIAVLNAAPYGSGILAKGPDVYPRFRYRDASLEMIDQVRRMQAACSRYDIPLAAAALQFSMWDPRITATIVGMTKPERLTETLALATLPIPDELWGELREMIG